MPCEPGPSKGLAWAGQEGSAGEQLCWPRRAPGWDPRAGWARASGSRGPAQAAHARVPQPGSRSPAPGPLSAQAERHAGAGDPESGCRLPHPGRVRPGASSRREVSGPVVPLTRPPLGGV